MKRSSRVWQKGKHHIQRWKWRRKKMRKQKKKRRLRKMRLK